MKLVISTYGSSHDYTTIDYYLSEMKDDSFRQIGNALIALVLSQKQSEIDFSKNQDWYESFFQLLRTSSNEDVKNTKIITFNYDTSLEKYLEKKILSIAPRSDQKNIKEKLRTLEFLHPHGMLQFNKVFNTESVFLENSIKTISDDFKNDPTYQKAQNIIIDSREIIFMGFGYHNEILDNLFNCMSEVPIQFSDKHIVGTNYKFQVPETKHPILKQDIFPKKGLNCKELIELLIKYNNVHFLKDGVYTETVKYHNDLQSIMGMY